MSVARKRNLTGVGLTLAGLLLGAACGGGDDETEALREELAELREQVSTTTTAVPPTTTTVPPTTTPEVSTTTTTVPATTTTKAPSPPATQRATPTTQPPTTSTTVPPTTTTTVKKPQGTVTWEPPAWYGEWQTGEPPWCAPAKIHVINRSDTGVLDVTFGGITAVYSVKDPDGTTRAVTGKDLGRHTIPAGIAPYGETDVTVNWCEIGGQNMPVGTYAWRLWEHGSHMNWTWMGQPSLG